MMRRKLMFGAALSIGALGVFAGPVAAHECFNPNKPAGAGVNYTITEFGPNGPVFVQTGPGKGIGGFATVFGVDVHTLGNSPSKELVGGPGSLKAEHACDGKGIDFLGSC